MAGRLQGSGSATPGRVLGLALGLLVAADTGLADPPQPSQGWLVHQQTGEPLRMFRRRYRSGRVFGPEHGLGRYRGRWGYGHWHLVPEAGGTLRLLSGNRKYCLGSTGPAGALELAGCVAGLEAQRWRQEPIPGGGFRLRNLAADRLLGVVPDAPERRRVRLVEEGSAGGVGWRLEAMP